jgi:hypothetical protein
MSGTAWPRLTWVPSSLYPGFNVDLSNQPYYVVFPRTAVM